MIDLHCQLILKILPFFENFLNNLSSDIILNYSLSHQLLIRHEKVINIDNLLFLSLSRWKSLKVLIHYQIISYNIKLNLIFLQHVKIVLHSRVSKDYVLFVKCIGILNYLIKLVEAELGILECILRVPLEYDVPLFQVVRELFNLVYQICNKFVCVEGWECRVVDKNLVWCVPVVWHAHENLLLVAKMSFEWSP